MYEKLQGKIIANIGIKKRSVKNRPFSFKSKTHVNLNSRKLSGSTLDTFLPYAPPGLSGQVIRARSFLTLLDSRTSCTICISLLGSRCNGITLGSKLNRSATRLNRIFLSYCHDYLPCPLYFFSLRAFGPLDLLCLPSLRLPNVTFTDDPALTLVFFITNIYKSPS